MILEHSILCTTFAIVSLLLGGCGANAPDDNSMKTQMALNDETVSAPTGYGYEMLPLQLTVDAVAPSNTTSMPHGRVAPEEIVRQATNRIGSLRACYATALLANPTLSGEARAIIKFEDNGTVKSVDVDSVSDVAFADCVKMALSTMEVPASNAGALEVRYPIALDPAVFSSTL